MKYEDFHIRFEAKGGDKFTVKVESATGDDGAQIELTRSVEELLSLLQADIGSDRSPDSLPAGSGDAVREAEFVDDSASLREGIGRELFNDLLVGATASNFNQALGNARAQDAGLRIMLHIDPRDPDIARLASLPWELICQPEISDLPLTLSRGTPVVRYLDSSRKMPLRVFELPLRILVVVSSPEGVAKLDLEKERINIDKTWGNQPDVEVHYLEKPTLSALADQLATDDYHILHFMGHGGFDHSTGVGVLFMETDDGRVDPVDGKTLGVILQDAKSIRLVFLNACDTAKLARVAGTDPYAGVAAALVSAGIRAVIAMQLPVSDGAAIAFSNGLYSKLSLGHPLEGAVSEARKAVRNQDRRSIEWATPVLFMSSPDGNLFDIEQHVKKALPLPSSRVAVALSVFALAILTWFLLTRSEPQQLTLAGSVIDSTTESEVIGANLTLKGDGLADQQVYTIANSGKFEIPFTLEDLEQEQKLILSVEHNGYVSGDFPVTFSPTVKTIEQYRAALVPTSVSGCVRNQPNIVTVGFFGDPSGQQDHAVFSWTLAQGLENNLIPATQLLKLAPKYQPKFESCPKAQPSSSGQSDSFAKTLGAEVFIYGNVIKNEPGYKVQTFLGDRHDVLQRRRSIENSNVNIQDPLLTKLDSETHAYILFALARGYEDSGRFSECVTVLTVAQQLLEKVDPDMTRARESCQQRTGNAGLLK